MKRTRIAAVAVVALMMLTSYFVDIQAQPKQRGGKSEFVGKGKNCKPDRVCDSSQKRDCQMDRGKTRSQMRDSMRNEFKTNVLPKLQQLKAEFDAKLSKTTLNTLNDLRSRAAALRSENMQNKRGMRPGRANMDQTQREELRASRAEHREKMLAINTELDKIIENNKTLIEELGNSLNAIHSQMPGNCANGMPAHPRGNKQNLRRNLDSGMAGCCQAYNNPQVRRFLLWDGEEMFGNLDDADVPKAQMLSNKPNPFSESTIITVELPKSQKATVDLYNNQGAHLGQIFNGKLSEGTNEIKFNASTLKDLMPGVIIYTVTLEDGKKLSGKMIYKK